MSYMLNATRVVSYIKTLIIGRMISKEDVIVSMIKFTEPIKADEIIDPITVTKAADDFSID